MSPSPSKPSSSSGRVRLTSEWRAGVGDLRGEDPQPRVVGDEEVRLLAGHAPGPAHEAAHRLAEEQLGRGRRGVDADAQPGDVDALGDHAHGHDPRVARRPRTGRCGPTTAGRRTPPRWPARRSGSAAARRCRGRGPGRWRSPGRRRRAAGGRSAVSRSWAWRSTAGSHSPSRQSAVRSRCAERRRGRARRRTSPTRPPPSGAIHSMCPSMRGK